MKPVQTHSFNILPSDELYDILKGGLAGMLNPYFIIILEHPEEGCHEGATGTIHCINAGQMNYLKQQPIQGIAILFRIEFLMPLKEDMHLAISTGVFKKDYVRKVQISGLQYNEVLQIAHNLRDEVKGKGMYHLQLIYAQMKILLIQLARIARKDTVMQQNQHNDDQLLGEFISQVNNHFMVEKKVSFYAQKFGITPNYLNMRIKKMTGFPASYHIQQRIILEAKRKAQWELMNMKQIAYELGFVDISYFSRFFKKYSGSSFSDFKKKPVMA